jgi:hypothetical protein
MITHRLPIALFTGGSTGSIGAHISSLRTAVRVIPESFRQNPDALQAGEPVEKGRILDELSATTIWHHSHARTAMAQALRPRVVRPRRPRTPKGYANRTAVPGP